MGFEDSLARYYDEVSPFDEETYQFLKKHSNDGKVLDVGCATGAYATKLSEEDELIVKGIDLREDMINVAKKRIGTASFEVRDMFQIEETNCFNLVYSLDNKIAHLYDYLEIKNVIRIFLEALRKNGYIILEIANFARVFRQTVTELPIIETKHVKLSRHYQRKDGRILYKSILKTKLHKYVSENLLYPLTKEELEMIVSELKATVKFYSSFKEAQFHEDSLQMIAVIKK